MLYVAFGILTTAVNVATFWAISRLWTLPLVASVAAAWFVSVCVAFFTNRRWVFRSQRSKALSVAGEFAIFVVSRLATGVVDAAVTLALVEWAGADDVVGKTASNVLVVVLNYLVSKLMIFRSSKGSPP